MLFTAQHPNIFNQHRDCPVHVGDKLHMVGISVFFHRDRDLDAGVSVQLLFSDKAELILVSPTVVFPLYALQDDLLRSAPLSHHIHTDIL